MFIPKNYKFRKQQKGKNFSKIKSKFYKRSTNNVYLKAIDFGRLKSCQLKALKLTLGKKLKKKGRLVFKIFPHTPITKKPLEVRMGKGKGPFDHWIAKIKPGTTICYIETNYKVLAKKGLEYAKVRLPIKTKVFS